MKPLKCSSKGHKGSTSVLSMSTSVVVPEKLLAQKGVTTQKKKKMIFWPFQHLFETLL